MMGGWVEVCESSRVCKGWGGPSKHGEMLSAIALPALSMTRARAAHDHFRMQGQKMSQNQKPMLTACYLPRQGTAAQPSLEHYHHSMEIPPPLIKRKTNFWYKCLNCSLNSQVCTEYLLCAPCCGFKNKEKQTRPLPFLSCYNLPTGRKTDRRMNRLTQGYTAKGELSQHTFEFPFISFFTKILLMEKISVSWETAKGTWNR